MESNSILLREFTESVFSNQNMDTMLDCVELSMEYIFSEDNPLGDLPLIQSIRLLGKAGLSIQRGFEIKNQLVFLQGIQKGKLELEGLAKRQEAFRNNEPWVFREVERLCVYLSRNTDVRKAKIQAALYLEYISHKLSEEEFGDYLDIIDQLLLSDIPHLLDLFDYQAEHNITEATLLESKDKFDFAFNLPRCNRLSSLGLLLRVRGFSFGMSARESFILSDSGKYIARLVRNLSEKA